MFTFRKFWKRQASIPSGIGLVQEVTSAKVEPDSNLYRYAKEELRLAGWLEEDGMYGSMIGDAVLDIVEVFAKQGHSGMSGSITLNILTQVLAFKPLTPLTYAPDEWNHINEDIAGGRDLYQNRRNSSVFSDDGLKTWYDISDGKYPSPRHPIITSGAGDECPLLTDYSAITCPRCGASRPRVEK